MARLLCFLALLRPLASVRVQQLDLAEDPTPLWCAAISGNGGNWAVTLGFLSEALSLYLESGEAPQRLDLRCAAGGSSGSAVTLLIRNLLENPGFNISGAATQEQAKLISKAMSFLAMSADLTMMEVVSTATRFLKQKATSWGPDAWEKSTPMDVPGTLLQFGRTLVLARHMKPEWLDLEAAEMVKGHSLPFISGGEFTRARLLEAAKDAGLGSAADLPELKESATKEQLEKVMPDIAQGVKHLTQHFMKEHGYWGARMFTPLNYLSQDVQPSGLDVVPHEANVVDQVLAERPEDGFITVVWGHARVEGELVTGATWEGLHILALMSRGTAQAILSSPEFHRKVLACREDAGSAACAHTNRYRLAVVDQLRPMVLLSTMEPGMVAPHVRPLLDFGIRELFDPETADLRGSSWKLSLVPHSYELVVGGFVDRGHAAPLLQHYAEGTGRGGAAAFALFGKLTDPKVGKKAVVDLLSANATQGEENWQEYLAWAAPRPAKTFVDGKLEWDCGLKLPANIAGASWQLRLHGAARARSCRGGEAARRPVFDPMEECEDGLS